ncbi:geranylgeranyl transferase type-1 subunit beta-like protein, partial [Backusella circina FSU 941]
MTNQTEIDVDKLARYFKSHLTMLPTEYTQTETNRMTLAFFSLASLSLLGQLDAKVNETNKKDWIEWIYAQQVLPTGEIPDANENYCGFRGSSWSGRVYEPNAETCSFQHYDCGHIANTYTALLNLLILGDDLSRVNRTAIVKTLKKLQQEDGSIAPTFGSVERDVRFIYCACSISYMLNDWSGLDVEKTVDHIKRLQSYEYAVAQCPGEEGHGGSTFCGVSSLALLGRLQDGLNNREKLIKWCLDRQVTGFQGRPNKVADVCYGFWIGGSLDILDGFDMVNHEELLKFLTTCQTKMGGFAKEPECYPDLLHSYMAVAVLSLLKTPGIEPIHTPLNAPMSAFEQLKTTAFWKSS